MALTTLQWIINVLLIHLIIFYILSVSVTTRVYSVITLILSYIIVSAIAVLYNQTFIAVVLLMIYAGAISIFFIFMVMLLNSQRRGTGGAKLTAGIFLAFFVLFSLLSYLVTENFFNLTMTNASEFSVYGSGVPYCSDFVKEGWTNNLVIMSNTSQLVRVGFALYTAYVYAFIGAGLLLLVAIVGVTSVFNYTPRLQKSREEDNLQILRGLKK